MPTKKPKLTREQRLQRRQLMAQMRDSGKTLVEIAEELGVGHNTVHRACQEFHVKENTFLDKQRRRREIALKAKKCKSIADVASEFSVSSETVRLACKEFGVTRFQRNKPS